MLVWIGTLAALRVGVVILSLCVAWDAVGSAMAGDDAEWRIIKPSTTGIPGEEVRFITFDPDGNLWVAARWPVWEEAGIARLPDEDLALITWPFGGFDTGRWTTWSNVHHPLPSQFINDMEFSVLEEGIVWLALGLTTNAPADGGLVRFDSNAPDGSEEQWTVYDASNSPLLVNPVLSIAQDSEGVLWLVNTANAPGANDGAVFRFDPRTNEWTEYNVGEELPWYLPWTNVGGIYVSSDDHVWATHQTLGGLAEFDGTNWLFHDSGHPGFSGMLEDHDGNIWLRPNIGSSGLWKWTGEAFESWDVIGGDSDVTALGIDASGLVYVGMWNGGIYTMVNGDTPVPFTNINTIYPNSIRPLPEGDVWIGSLGAIRQYNSEGVWQRGMSTYNTGLGWYFIAQIHADPDGEMWFSSGENGATRFDGQRSRNFGLHNAGSEPWPFVDDEPIDGVFQDSRGDVWMGGNGIMRWHESTGEVTGFWDYPVVGSYGGDFAQTPDGRVWAGRITGVYGHVESNDTWEHPVFSGGNTVEGMCVRADGTLCVVTTTYLRLYDGQSWTHFNSENAPIPPGTFSAIDAHPDGSIWMAHDRGLLRYDGVNWTRYTSSNSGLFQNWVTDVKIREDGLIAAASVDYDEYVGGISLFDGTTWTTFTPQNSPLTHWQVEALEFDTHGHLWASPTSEGVVQILLGQDMPSIATLVDVDVLRGILMGGGLDELQASDDAWLHTRSGFGPSFTDLHSLDLLARAHLEGPVPATLNVTIESRIDSPSGLMQIRLRNWQTDAFDLVGSFQVGNVETSRVVNDIPASAYVKADGTIEMTVRHAVFVPFFAYTFQSYFDQVEIRGE